MNNTTSTTVSSGTGVVSVGDSIELFNSGGGSEATLTVPSVFAPTLGDVWSQQAKLTASDAASNDEFGLDVSMSGDYAIVGANSGDQRPGSAYIFKKATTSLNQVGHAIPDEHTAYYGASDWICQSVSGTVGIYKHIYRTGTPVDSGLNTIQYDSSTSTWSDHGTGQPQKYTKNDHKRGKKA